MTDILASDFAQPKGVHANLEMIESVPFQHVKRLEYKHLLKRLDFSLDVVQAIVCNHGYDTTKILSCLKSRDDNILVKTLCSLGGEHEDGTSDPRLSVSHMAQQALFSVCSILYH